MLDDPRILLAVLAMMATLGALPLAGWLLAKRRHPCPHCGRKAGRAIRQAYPIPGVLVTRDLTYECCSCGGSMRYARRPNGQEFWEPIGTPSREAS